MQRRSLLKLGAASAAVLTIAGGGVALMNPGLAAGGLSAGAREVFRAVGEAILEGSLPAAPAARTAAIEGMLERIEGLVSALPAHSQKELSLLLGLLASAPGRHTITGLRARWVDADIPQVQQALQVMRTSAMSLRQQAYHALHDIVGGAYFSDPGTWAQLGYPGPLNI